ncbi:lipopolysaccharide biosynthesis protein [Sphingomonas sp.]|uniref:lipopolysaccharide biosynthesis protein n=1 Tax=Sphingomonas sp. TaxID=28214 RepID=UPI0035C820E8
MAVHFRAIIGKGLTKRPRKVFATVLVSIAVAGFVFMQGIVVSYLVHPEARGILGSVQNTLFIFVQALGFGIARSRHDERPMAVKEARFSPVIALALFGFSTVLAVFSFVHDQISTAFYLSAIVALCGIAATIQVALQTAAMVEGHINILNLMRLVQPIFYTTVLTALMLLTCSQGAPLLVIFVLLASSYVAATIGAGIKNSPFVQKVRSGRCRVDVFVSTFLAVLLSSISARMDVFAISTGMSLTDQGYYYTSLSFASALLVVPNAVNMNFFKKLNGASRLFIVRYTAGTTALCVVQSLFVIVVAPIAVHYLFAAEYGGALAMLPLAVLYVSLGIVASVAEQALLARSKSRTVAICKGAQLSLCAVLLFVLPRQTTDYLLMPHIIAAVIGMLLMHGALYMSSSSRAGQET